MKKKLEEFLNSRGFYTAIFTCLFAVLAIAAFVSIRNIDAITKLTTYGEKDVSLDDQLLPAQAQQDIPISELAAEYGDTALEEQERSVRKTEEPGQIKSETKTGNPPVTPKTEQKPTSTGVKQETKPEQEQEKKDSALNEQAKKETPPAETPKPEPAPEAKKEETKPNTDNAEQKPTAGADFSAEEMVWPLDGAIVMDFSTEHAIYDKTLEQYRTNPTISISSEVGSQVKSAADGIVKSITIDPRTGYTLEIDHGNGWLTKYGQLQETILVKEGDSVKKGQAVGGVGSPTKYGVLLGPHLLFGINKDDVPQNPNVVLAE